MRRFVLLSLLLGVATLTHAQSRPVLEVAGVIGGIDQHGEAVFVIQEISSVSSTNELIPGAPGDFDCKHPGGGEIPQTTVREGERIPITWTADVPKYIKLIPKKSAAITLELPEVGWQRRCGNHLQQLYAAFFVEEGKRAKTRTVVALKKGWPGKFLKSPGSSDATEMHFVLRLSWDKEYYTEAYSGHTTDLRAIADLVVTQLESGPVAPGGDLTIRVTVINRGPKQAIDVRVESELSPDVTFVRMKGCDEVLNDGPICVLSKIPKNGERKYSISLNVNPSASGVMTNTAVVTSDTTDLNPENNSDVATTYLHQEQPTEVAAKAGE